MNDSHTPRGLLIGLLMFVPACRAAPPAHERKSIIPEIQLARAFPRLTFERPIWMCQAPGDPTRMYLIEQAGRIHVFQNRPGVAKSDVFLDLSDRTQSYANGGHNEEGLLCLAFDPDFARNRRFYVHHSAGHPRRGVISRFETLPNDPAVADPKSEKVILEVPKPFGNHCGCCLLFGPDGYLYATFGDGGSAGDPFNNGQNLNTLLGKCLRIDVRHAGGDKLYVIPNDNPFVTRKSARPEIWAYGLRNVWRMSFDRKTHALWAGDVGQDRWEEIDLITKGGDYGWRCREGKHPFNRKTKATGKLIEPIVEYNHSEGMSITGGYVYRGTKYPKLQGVYLYADYVLGTIWGLRYENGKLTDHRVVLKQPLNIASFAEDAAGELYVLCFDGGIYRVESR